MSVFVGGDRRGYHRAEYPMVAARLTSPAEDIGAVSEERFGVALGCLLDGLEARARAA